MLSYVFACLLLSQAIAANPNYRELEELAKLLNIYEDDFVRNSKRLTETDRGDFIEICSQEPLDICLVIDSSSSIYPTDFKKGQEFLRDFLSQYDIGSGKSQVRVAAVTYGRGVYEDDAFGFLTYKTKEDVLNAIVNMPFKAGLSTDTGDAIKYMRERQMNIARPGVPKITIVLTDGNSQRGAYTAEQAAYARDQNITMFAVGVGRAVTQAELLRIAGEEKRVLSANSYAELEQIKKELAHRTCITKPKPTTTPPAAPPCGDQYPSDINFVFSPASLGVDATSWVTQFISHTISNEELENGFQYGVLSGECPKDAGFALDEYATTHEIRNHLTRYDSNRLPAIISQTVTEGFTTSNGARSSAYKVSVIFLNKVKVDTAALNRSIQELLDSGVHVFVARPEAGVYTGNLPTGVTVLDEGSSISQATEFVNKICHLQPAE